MHTYLIIFIYFIYIFVSDMKYLFWCLSCLSCIPVRNDPILPFAASGWCKDLLENGGAKVEYNSHGGGHEVGATTLPTLMQFLDSL
jgi:hypothetical protein